MQRTSYLLFLLLALNLLLPALPAQSPEKLTLDDLKILLSLKVDQKEIIQQVRQAKEVQIKASDLVELHRLGAGKDLLAELNRRVQVASGEGSGQDLVGALLARLKRGDKEEAILAFLYRQGRIVELAATDILRLRRAGASAAVLQALSGRHTYPGLMASIDPLGFLRLQHPKGWRAYHWFQDEVYWILASPETDMTGPNQFRTGVQIQVRALAPGSLEERLGTVEHHRRTLPALLRSNRGYKLAPLPGAAGAPQAIQVAGGEAVSQGMSLTMRGTPCLSRLVRFHRAGLSFYVEAIAPTKAFAGLAPVFDRLVTTLRPFPHQRQLQRRAKPLDRVALMERLRPAVVMVRAYFDKNRIGYGSAFFVRPDGYILTNHHVVHNRQGQRARKLEVVWDAAVGPKAPGQENRVLPATLIASVRRNSPLLDLALLRVPRGAKPYRTIPFCPVEDGKVQQGDEVVALGFPVPSSLRKVGRLIPTNGHVSRINRLSGTAADSPLDDMLLDITINQGNSGGPAVSLRTGGVVGLNTQVVISPVVGGEMQKLEYGRVCLLDYALKEFPQIRWYPRNRLPRGEEHTELAAMLLTMGNMRAAAVELDAAGLRERDMRLDQRADLAYQRARFYTLIKKSDKAFSWLQKALALDPAHQASLQDLAMLHADKKRYDKAVAVLEQLIQLAPDAWGPRDTAAEVYRRSKDLTSALRSVAEAEERGGGYHPNLLHRKGTILEQMKKPAEAEKAYRRGADLDPSRPDCRLALARLLAARREPGRARLEYGKLLKHHPGNPAVHLAYAGFLEKQRDTATAVDHLVKAVRLERVRQGRPGPDSLGRLSRLGVGSKDARVRNLALEAAVELHREWPTSRRQAHRWLARLWRQRGRTALASLHDRAGGLFFANGAVLAKTDLHAMVAARYSTSLFKETLNAGALGVLLDKSFIGEIKRYRWKVWQLASVLDRAIQDQMRDNRALGKNLVEIRTEGPVRFGTNSPYAVWKVRNRGKVPITSIRVFLQYQDAKKKTLYSGTLRLPTWFLPLQPGQERRGLINFHPWKTLQAKGLTRTTFKTLTRSVSSARNGTYLTKLSVHDVKYTKTGLTFKLRNNSTFKLSSLSFRCDFLDSKNRPITTATLRNTPARDGVTFSRLTLNPKSTTGTLRVSSWANRPHLQKIFGIPLNQTIRMRVAIAEAQLTKVKPPQKNPTPRPRK